MTFDVLSDLNWLAVVVAALAYFVLGGLWYAPPVFGNAWMKAAGIEMEGEGPGAAIYAFPLLGCVVATIATAMLAAATASDTLGEGVVLGLVVGIGYAVTVGFVTATFETTKPQKWVWFEITAAYHLVGLVIAAAIVSAWT